MNDRLYFTERPLQRGGRTRHSLHPGGGALGDRSGRSVTGSLLGIRSKPGASSDPGGGGDLAHDRRGGGALGESGPCRVIASLIRYSMVMRFPCGPTVWSAFQRIGPLPGDVLLQRHPAGVGQPVVTAQPDGMDLLPVELEPTRPRTSRSNTPYRVPSLNRTRPAGNLSDLLHDAVPVQRGRSNQRGQHEERRSRSPTTTTGASDDPRRRRVGACSSGAAHRSIAATSQSSKATTAKPVIGISIPFLRLRGCLRQVTRRWISPPGHSQRGDRHHKSPV